MKLHEGREAQAQARGIVFGKRVAQEFVEEKTRLEVGTGGGVLDRADAVAQVQTLGALFGSGEQSLQASAQVRGFADIGLGGGLSAEEEDGRSGRGGGEDLRVVVWDELHPVGQHIPILERSEVHQGRERRCNFAAGMNWSCTVSTELFPVMPEGKMPSG